MLSIDEAIAHARKVANTQKGKSGICLQNGLECEHFSDCLKCAEEHEQLAEWLEELKAIKDGSIPIIHGKAELELHDKAIRNDAIDDFVHKVKEHHYVLSDVINSTDYGMFTVGIEQIAEELKAGVKNE